MFQKILERGGTLVLRVLVTGGRNFNDYLSVVQVLDNLNRIHPITAIAHGGASGADSLANDWALFRKKKWAIYTYLPDWQKHGKAAGVIRNVEMLQKFKPWIVVAFPGGKGTKHMVKIARKANIRVDVVPDRQLAKDLENFIQSRFECERSKPDKTYITHALTSDLSEEISIFLAERAVSDVTTKSTGKLIEKKDEKWRSKK
jgi:hypothetical protein